MRKQVTSLSAAIAAVALAGAAQAQHADSSEADGWYLAASGTVSLLQDAHQVVSNAPTPSGIIEAIHRQDTGYGVQAQVGRKFGQVRAELEAGYTTSPSHQYTAIVPPTGNIPSDGHQNAFRIMANGYFDFGSGPVQPYVGAGAGWTRVLIKVTAPPANEPTSPPLALLNDHDSRFAYQLMGGVAVKLSPSISLTTQYRWFSAGDLHFHDLGASRPVTRHHAGHNIDIGIRVRL